MKQERVDLTRLAQDINQKLQNEHPDRKAQVEIQQGLDCVADEGLIKVVLTNLFDNAWKYTARTAHPEIHFSATSSNSETVYCVADNGAGFSMKYVDKLFGAFQRLHRGEDFSGTGIGLATVARIIHRHQGQVWAEGKEQHGAQFYFSLPRTTEKHEQR
jgi:light-regulated signal transduction histidine kinase (bacteriophytochrome)